MIITDNNKIKTSEMMDKFKNKFNTYYYWSSGESDTNFPQPKESTTREFKEEQESTDYKGQRYDEIPNKEELMSFREYLIAFEYYFDKYGRYLDTDGITLFGDRLPSGGKVAFGRWYSRSARAEFTLGSRNCSLPCLGARVAISLNPLSLKTKGTVITQLDRIESKLDKLLKAKKKKK